jgi:hypothetical protein
MATKILEAKKILEQYAPAGEFLAYISKEEAELLKSLGSSGTPVEETGIPSFQLPGYLEDTAKDYAKQAKATYGVPIDTAKFTGQQFVAGEDPLQTQAVTLAQQGVGAYEPYLQAAQAGVTAAGTAQAGLGALTGAQAYQPFMSPYQQDVIDTSLTEFDRQAQMRQQQMQDQTLGVPGAFGGGREGVQLAEYQAGSDRNRAALEAQMRQQNFQQAQQGAQTAFGQQQAIAQGQLGMGQAQLGLSQFQRAGLGADVGALGQLGSLRQAQTQAGLSAQQQAAQTAAYEPYGRLAQYGQGITGLTGGVAAAQYAQPQQASPWSSALTTALGVGGLYQKMFMPQQQTIKIG